MNWITNNPEAAAKLKAADKQYQDERAKAIALPLYEKIAALGAAKQRYLDACRAIAIDAAPKA